MIPKVGDILWPVDSAFKYYKPYIISITGMLVITSIEIDYNNKTMCRYIHFYQLNKHKHEWHTLSWVEKHYKALQ